MAKAHRDERRGEASVFHIGPPMSRAPAIKAAFSWAGKVFSSFLRDNKNRPQTIAVMAAAAARSFLQTATELGEGRDQCHKCTECPTPKQRPSSLPSPRPIQSRSPIQATKHQATHCLNNIDRERDRDNGRHASVVASSFPPLPKACPLAAPAPSSSTVTPRHAKQRLND